MNENDQPVFPLNTQADPAGCTPSYGMTLRQHYAGLAMQSWLAITAAQDTEDGMPMEGTLIAKMSFTMADAMLGEGDKPDALERITAERDELLAALEQSIRSLVELAVSVETGRASTPEQIEKVIAAATTESPVGQARAAIAKAKGEQP